MSHYSDDPRMVQVDFFKPSGKWYCTEAIRWLTWESTTDHRSTPQPKGKLIHDAFEEALAEHFGDKRRLRGMWAVCLDPYHQDSYPLMMVVR